MNIQAFSTHLLLLEKGNLSPFSSFSVFLPLAAACWRTVLVQEDLYKKQCVVN